jgi:hypothetical protein
MQRKEIVEIDKINEVMKLVFQIGEIQTLEASYKIDREIIVINDYQNYLKFIEERINEKERSIDFALHYKKTEGFVYKERVVLDPKYSNGKLVEYISKGWGIIYIQLRFLEEKIECTISANTEKRALTWAPTLSIKFKSPNLWNWKIVESKTRKLIQKLRD